MSNELKCQNCRFECDASDAFCRKCGAALVHEGSFSEVAGSGTVSLPEAPVIEVITVTPGETTTAVTVSGGESRRSQLGALSRRVGSKISQALKSEQGKKLAQGATALVVAVGVELVTQAATRLSKTQPTPKAGKLDRPPVGVGDALLKALEDGLARADEPEVEEIYMRERIYIRRTVRRSGQTRRPE